MKMLGLDISSATIGWALFEFDAQTASLIEHGHIRPPPAKKGSLAYRISTAYDEIEKLLNRLKPDEVVIEDYAKKFSAGKSRAHTIILLSVFNEVTSLVVYRCLGLNVFRYPVVSIRSELSKFFKTKIVSKDDIFPVICQRCLNFKIKINKKGKTLKQCYDEADAVSCGITHLIRKHPSIKNWQL